MAPITTNNLFTEVDALLSETSAPSAFFYCHTKYQLKKLLHSLREGNISLESIQISLKFGTNSIMIYCQGKFMKAI